MWLGCLPYFHFIIAVSWDGAREEKYCARVSGCRPKKMPSRLPCCTFRTSPLPAVGLLIRKLASKQKDREGSTCQKVCSAFFSVDNGCRFFPTFRRNSLHCSTWYATDHSLPASQQAPSTLPLPRQASMWSTSFTGTISPWCRSVAQTVSYYYVLYQPTLGRLFQQSG